MHCEIPEVAYVEDDIAEFERELIRDRVRSGLALAKVKGKCIGRRRVLVDALQIASLRSQGHSWSQITAKTGISKGTAQRALAALPKTPSAAIL
jgi:DNA invertase Pin-like site-specific DNA recombinase